MIFHDRTSEYIYLVTQDYSKGLYITGVPGQMVYIQFVLLQFTTVFVQGYLAFIRAFFRVIRFCGEPHF